MSKRTKILLGFAGVFIVASLLDVAFGDGEFSLLPGLVFLFIARNFWRRDRSGAPEPLGRRVPQTADDSSAPSDVANEQSVSRRPAEPFPEIPTTQGSQTKKPASRAQPDPRREPKPQKTQRVSAKPTEERKAPKPAPDSEEFVPMSSEDMIRRARKRWDS